MHCKSCDYPLWNLTTRRCPECGTDFKPSDFEFEPHAVRFCCPHCDHPYFGTGEKGHLHPTEFPCVACGERIAFDETIVRPGLGVEERRIQLDPMPWIHRAERGRFRSWFQTIGRAMTAPQRLIRSVPADHSGFDAWWFGVLTTTLILIVGTTLPWGVYGAMLMSFGLPFSMYVPWWVTLLGSIVGSLLSAVLIVTLWALLAHGFLRITGGLDGRFRDTMQAVGYGAGANILSAVPCCGICVGWIWWVVSSTIMLKERCNVGSVRATFAILIFPMIGIAAYFSLYIIAIFMSAGGFRGGWVGGPGTTAFQTNQISNAVLMYGGGGGGAGLNPGPDHALELALGGNLAWMQGCPFAHPSTATTAADIPIGDGTYTDFAAMSASGKLSAAAQAIEATPANVIAHRLGDYVFVHHGMPAGTWDGQLWVVLMVPDPAVNTLSQDTTVEIGLADYTTATMTYGELLNALPAQNKVRASHGMPPLPDPATVTHDSPAVQSEDVDDG